MKQLFYKKILYKRVEVNIDRGELIMLNNPMMPCYQHNGGSLVSKVGTIGVLIQEQKHLPGQGGGIFGKPGGPLGPGGFGKGGDIMGGPLGPVMKMPQPWQLMM